MQEVSAKVKQFVLFVPSLVGHYLGAKVLSKAVNTQKSYTKLIIKLNAFL